MTNNTRVEYRGNYATLPPRETDLTHGGRRMPIKTGEDVEMLMCRSLEAGPGYLTANDNGTDLRWGSGN